MSLRPDTQNSEHILNYDGVMPATRTARQSFQSSSLSRHAVPVFAAAERAPVEVTRRDGDSLVLMSSAEADARESLLELAAQLIAATTDDRGTLAERLSERFDWMLALSPAERDTCARDLITAARASFATGQAHLAIAELASWRSTAEALASGLGRDRVGWYDDAPRVPRP